MQLDKFSDYALRIMMVLAVKRPERVSVRHISEMFDISENHVAKIATTLAREGFVISQRGRAGGLILAVEPEKVRIGELVCQIKETTPVVECFGGHNTCVITPACGLRRPLAQAQAAFFAALDQYTLADIVVQRSALADLLAEI